MKKNVRLKPDQVVALFEHYNSFVRQFTSAAVSASWLPGVSASMLYGLTRQGRPYRSIKASRRILLYEAIMEAKEDDLQDLYVRFVPDMAEKLNKMGM